ncbi:hypothetical protein G8T60_12740 [Clostridium botulinum C]|uniref:hypothetical protein n=1 Tax=Clostridium botulinum TaxID=1491 RepID=UPI001E2C83C5|nr:hypothetical protein [Clostridium botulinum]MCD3206756.1 hypothetical protein [Clostridium botulinum C]MCD3209659.1 hypothetical protein [Clostridium botulinum C]MCD3226556.1 hypothetical protein [Clostridium botulinum C]MCD3248990.1 hypothetical protein [Clostridium botulinum C]MCD3257574.1 hypothetical protein [Clostridium botulinum C]
MDIIMQNENYKMLKISDTEYKILDNENHLVLGMEGKNYTREDLEEQFNNCLKNCIFI